MIDEKLLIKIKELFWEEFKEKSLALSTCEFKDGDDLNYDELVEGYGVNSGFADELENVYMLYAIAAGKTLAQKIDDYINNAQVKTPVISMKDLEVTIANNEFRFVLATALV